MAIVHTTESILKFSSDRGCSHEPGWVYKGLREKVTLYRNEFIYKIELKWWIKRGTVDWNAVYNKEEIIRALAKKQDLCIPVDWVYVSATTRIPMFRGIYQFEVYYPKLKNGVLVKDYTAINITEVIRILVANEGFTVDNNWEYKKADAEIPIIHGIYKHGITYTAWMIGSRLDWVNCINKTEVVTILLKNEGCSLPIKWFYQDYDSVIPVIYNGITYKISWRYWVRGVRPFETNKANEFDKIDKTLFVINLAKTLGFILSDNYQYTNCSDSFDAKTLDGKPVRLRANDLQQGIYPGSLKKLIIDGVKDGFRERNKSRTFSKTTFANSIIHSVLKNIGERPSSDHHLDHIIPHSYFDYDNEEEIRQCWHYQNLRWLPSSENISRSNRLTAEEILKFNPAQLAILQSATQKVKYGLTNEMVQNILTSQVKVKAA